MSHQDHSQNPDRRAHGSQGPESVSPLDRDKDPYWIAARLFDPSTLGPVEFMSNRALAHNLIVTMLAWELASERHREQNTGQDISAFASSHRAQVTPIAELHDDIDVQLVDNGAVRQREEAFAAILERLPSAFS
jgi:hypothetical protein